MAPSVNTLENLAVVRLLEFLSDRSPWYRSLWGIGIVLALNELYEACTVMAEGHLNEASLKRVIGSIRNRVRHHPVFTAEERGLLNQNLGEVPRPGSVQHFTVRQISLAISADYLARWARVVNVGNFNVELFARSVAGHLLDAGFSGQYLRSFINTRYKGVAPFSLALLCKELQQEITETPVRNFDVLQGFEAIPRMRNGVPSGWLQGSAVIDWLKRHKFETAGVRAPGAIIITVKARDSIGAAHLARSESDRYAARALLATGTPLKRVPTLWIAGDSLSVDLNHDRRGVEVRELYREDRIFTTDHNKSVDAALELLAHLDGSSPAAAVAGGWGAIEGLLAPPNDRSSAADNLAALVACSFPRAELTRLAHQVQTLFPGTYPALEAAPTNRERSRIVGQMIMDGTMPGLQWLSDQAAVARMKKLFRDPKNGLATVREVISDSFHRLYRQRNLILHGGKLDSVALTPSLRTVAKLAGAGMDRITHGHYVQQVEPLELVAKANFALATVDPVNPLMCVELLEVS